MTGEASAPPGRVTVNVGALQARQIVIGGLAAGPIGAASLVSARLLARDDVREWYRARAWGL